MAAIKTSTTASNIDDLDPEVKAVLMRIRPEAFENFTRTKLKMDVQVIDFKTSSSLQFAPSNFEPFTPQTEVARANFRHGATTQPISPAQISTYTEEHKPKNNK